MLAQVQAQWGNIQQWSFGQILIAIIVIAGAIAITIIALRQFGMTLPQWLIQMLIVVAVVIVAVFLLRVVLGA